MKEPIRQGFSWATREGPLCEERKCLSVLEILIPHTWRAHVDDCAMTRADAGDIHLLKEVTAERTSSSLGSP